MRSRILSFCVILSFRLAGQNINPGVDQIYRPDELAIVFLTLSPADKAFLQDPANALSEVYVEASFRMKNSKMDTTLAKTVGVRLRGNTSRYAEKKSFKIDFREFGGKKFFGYKKFNFKANVNDPSQVREPLTLLLFREIEVPAARTHPLRLYMNGEYMGTYINVEQVDDVFLTQRYGHSTGFLYKCAWGANLVDNGQVFSTALFESEINTTVDTRAELDHFVKVLNSTSDQLFSAEIEKVFQVDRYIRHLAVEALLGHWDGYSYNQNNFYLFYNGQTGKVEFFPYDADNTWGIDWVNQDWGTRDLNNWPFPGEDRPLTNRILHVPVYRQKYEAYLKGVLETTFRKAYLYPLLTSYQNILEQAVLDDHYFSKAFGFRYADFLSSFNVGMNNHVEYGLREYLDKRTQYAIGQIPTLVTGVPEEIPDKALVFPNPSQRPVLYYYSTDVEMTYPAVYNSTGTRIPVSSRVLTDQKVEVTLPEGTPKGLYLIQTPRKFVRWVYY
jgi:spore coat protein H